MIETEYDRVVLYEQIADDQISALSFRYHLLLETV